MQAGSKRMKVLIVGAAAGGTKVGAKLKRELGKDAEIHIITKSDYAAYHACAIPFYLNGMVPSFDSLIDGSPEDYAAIADVELSTGIEAVKLDRTSKTVYATELKTGKPVFFTYDKLVITTGSRPVIPPALETGLQNVFVLREPDDAVRIKAAIDAGGIRRAAVVGGGIVGVQVAAALSSQGIRTCIIGSAAHILPGFDADMADYIENQLSELGIPVLSGDAVERLEGEGKVEKLRTSKRAVKADMVILAAGVQPNTEWLSGSGIITSENGAVIVDDYFRTNDPDIYSCGDCALMKNKVTGDAQWTSSGSLANIEGRLLAKAISGSASHGFHGVLGTDILSLPTINAGKTGLGIDEAKAGGFDAECVTITTDDKAKYYPGKAPYIIRMVAEKSSRKLLGIQVIGKGNIDKLIDIAATALTLGATLDQIEDTNFAHAPAFSTPVHPFAIAVYTLQNKLDGNLKGGTYQALNIDDSWTIIDAGKTQVIPQLRHVGVQSVNGQVTDIPFDSKVAILCAGGRWSYLTEDRMRRYGYSDVHSIEGGSVFNYEIENKYK